MDWDKIVRQWQAVLDANTRLGGESEKLIVGPPASRVNVEALEKRLGVPLPGSLRDTLMTFSGRVYLRWDLPEEHPRPKPLEESYGGWLEWSLDSLSESEMYRREWIRDVLSTRDDPVLQAGWDGTLGFHETHCGDCFAIDIAEADREAVVYLSHDEDCATFRPARDFQDFLRRASPLGCPGPDSFEWEPFICGEDGYIDPDCANAIEWKRVLGLEA